MMITTTMLGKSCAPSLRLETRRMTQMELLYDPLFTVATEPVRKKMFDSVIPSVQFHKAHGTNRIDPPYLQGCIEESLADRFHRHVSNCFCLLCFTLISGAISPPPLSPIFAMRMSVYGLATPSNYAGGNS
jgi:hypothetical protein